MAKQPGENERLTMGEITMYSKAGGHSYNVFLCVYVWMCLYVCGIPFNNSCVLARPLKHTSASN